MPAHQLRDLLGGRELRWCSRYNFRPDELLAAARPAGDVVSPLTAAEAAIAQLRDELVGGDRRDERG